MISRIRSANARALAAWFCAIILSQFVCVAASSQTGALPAVVTVGLQAPVVGEASTVTALVTNPALSPAPTGSIEFDFGDGTPTVTVPMDYRVAVTTHTYTTVGSVKVTASYSGDSNFAPASAAVQGRILTSAPNVTLHVYGDSISYALNRASATGPIWVNFLAYFQGWGVDDKALPSYKIADECPFIYGATITPSTYSAILIGQNDLSTNDLARAQYQHSLEACTAWLLIPGTSVSVAHPKVIAQDPSVAQSGTWTTSTLYSTMGLQTQGAGDSLTSTITGSSIYLGLSGTTASNYTVDVYVDGNLAGEYTPAIVYSGAVTPIAPWGIRIPVPGSTLTDSHTVTAVCKNPGTSGCFIDWMGGNGFVAPNELPLLWLGEPYHSNQTGWTYQDMLTYIQVIRQIGQDFQADGLGVTFADVFDNFDGSTDTQCMVDQVHPALCGHKIIAATFLGAMDWLFTKDQRIDFAPLSSVEYSSTPIPVGVSATSGLPVTLNVVSGPAAAAGDSITTSAVGSVTVQANQAGDANYLPAASAVEAIQVTPAPVTVVVVPSATQVAIPGTISLAVQVGWSGTSAVPGSVTLLDGSTVLGSAALDATGAATFTNLQLSLGTHVLTVSYPQQGNFAAGSSAPLSIAVVYPPPDVQVTESSTSASIASGQKVSFSLDLVPSLGFTPGITFTCEGLPALASCVFSQNPLNLGGAGGTETVSIVTTGRYDALPPVVAGKTKIGPLLVLAGLWWTPGLATWLIGFLQDRRSRHGSDRVGLPKLLVPAMFIVVLLFNGCSQQAAPATPAGSSTVTVNAVAAQGAESVTRTINFNLIVTK